MKLILTEPLLTSTGKLIQGVPISRILDDIRDDASSDRSSLIERRDLLNIMRDFGVGGAEQLHADDATSVHMWAHDMLAKGDVLFYKPQGQVDENSGLRGKDFMLVIMTKAQRDYFSALRPTAARSSRCAWTALMGWATTGSNFRQFYLCPT